MFGAEYRQTRNQIIFHVVLTIYDASVFILMTGAFLRRRVILIGVNHDQKY